MFFLLMILLPPRSTRTDTLLPDTRLVRSDVHDNLQAQEVLPSLVAMVFARPSGPERPGGPPGYRYESVVPLAGNRSLVGFDMAAQEANLRALLRARDIDRPVMSAAFPLRQPVDDAHDAMGVVVRLPVYSSGPRPSDVAQRRAREIRSEEH